MSRAKDILTILAAVAAIVTCLCGIIFGLPPAIIAFQQLQTQFSGSATNPTMISIASTTLPSTAGTDTPHPTVPPSASQKPTPTPTSRPTITLTPTRSPFRQQFTTGLLGSGELASGTFSDGL